MIELQRIAKQLTAAINARRPQDAAAFNAQVAKVFGIEAVPNETDVMKADLAGCTQPQMETYIALLGGPAQWTGAALGVHASLPPGEAPNAEPVAKSWSEQSAAERATTKLDDMASEDAKRLGCSFYTSYDSLLRGPVGKALYSVSVDPQGGQLIEEYLATLMERESYDTWAVTKRHLA